VFLLLYNTFATSYPPGWYTNIAIARGCSAAIVMVCAESVLAIRTWAAWKMNNVVGVGLLVLMLGYTAVQGILLYELTDSLFNPYSGIGTLAGTTSRSLEVTMWREYTGLAVIEFSV